MSDWKIRRFNHKKSARRHYKGPPSHYKYYLVIRVIAGSYNVVVKVISVTLYNIILRKIGLEFVLYKGGGCHSDWTRGTPKLNIRDLKETAIGLRVPRKTYLYTYIYTNIHTHTHTHTEYSSTEKGRRNRENIWENIKI